MTYKVVQKDRVLVQSEWLLVVPVSHEMETKAEALRWMSARGMQAYCEVLPADHNFERA